MFHSSALCIASCGDNITHTCWSVYTTKHMLEKAFWETPKPNRPKFVTHTNSPHGWVSQYTTTAHKANTCIWSGLSTLLLSTMNEVLAACLAMLIYSLLLYLPFSHTHIEDSEEPCALSLAVIFHTSRTWDHSKAWHLPECEEEPEWEVPCIVFKKLSLFFFSHSLFFSFLFLPSSQRALHNEIHSLLLLS